MFVQIFRNKISQSSQLKNQISSLETVIRSNLNQREDIIIKELTKEWNKGRKIYLGSFVLGGNSYYLWIHFDQWPTHGYPVDVEDIVYSNSDKLNFVTEYGDIAIIVDYLFQHTQISRKVSILQTKKEQRPGMVDIKLHQLYLMQNWPCVEFPTGTKYEFEGVNADEFSFYHFILNHSVHPQFSSSLCSSPLVGHLLGTTKTFLQKKLKKWMDDRRTHPNKAPPSTQLRHNLLPGAIYNASKYYAWKLIPKPFVRFLLDAAYLFVGTGHKDVLALTQKRVSTILAMKVVASREKNAYREI